MTRPAPRPRPRVGLALGSGGARGWAHLGVLRRLRELGVEPVCLAGTSIGAVAAALWATQTVEAMAELAVRLDWKRVAGLFLEAGPHRSGLITGRHMMRFFQSVIPARTFEELPVPVAAVATDLDSEQAVALRTGDLFKAIRASVAIPGIFTPVFRDGRRLVDGGLANPLPVGVCREMGADVVIVSDVNLVRGAEKKAPRRKPGKIRAELTPKIAAAVETVGRWMPRLHEPAETFARKISAAAAPDTRRDSLFDILTRSYRMMINQTTRFDLMRTPPDILIQPAVAHIQTLEFNRGEEAIEAGERAVDAALPLLLPLCRRPDGAGRKAAGRR